MPNEINTCGLLIEPLKFSEKGEPIWPTKPPSSLPLQALRLQDRQPFSGFCMPVIKNADFEQQFNDILAQGAQINFQKRSQPEKNDLLIISAEEQQLFQISTDDSVPVVQCSILTSEQIDELRKVEHFTWNKTTRQFIPEHSTPNTNTP